MGWSRMGAIRRSHLPLMVLHAIWSDARTWFPTTIVGAQEGWVGGGRDCEMEQKIGRAIGLVGEDAAYSTGLPSGRRHIVAERVRRFPIKLEPNSPPSSCFI